MPKTCPTCNGAKRVRRTISRAWWQVLLLRPATVDELCGQCVGTGVIKGTPEEEQEVILQRQRQHEAKERQAAEEKARRQRAAESRAAAEQARPAMTTARASSNEHYLLKCKDCSYTFHIARDCSDPTFTYSVDPDAVKLACVYGGRFTVSLEVREFFAIATVPASGKVLEASIGPNMRVLHGHMLSHCDPLFLIIQQSSNRSTHVYKKQPEGATYVKFSQGRGIDIVGNINMSKAEVPGVSE
jgi:hypothetical protein